MLQQSRIRGGIHATYCHFKLSFSESSWNGIFGHGLFESGEEERRRETKADDIIMRDEAIPTPRVGRDDAEAKECIAKERSEEQNAKRDGDGDADIRIGRLGIS